MSQPMTSWKEIAAYLGKSVRTAQRWERELALPVRRPNIGDRNVIIATREELESWVLAQKTSQPISEIDNLRARLATLEAENVRLSQELRGGSAELGSRCELLRQRMNVEGERSMELSLKSAFLQNRSDKLSQKSRILRGNQ
jgi:hypothetical protein